MFFGGLGVDLDRNARVEPHELDARPRHVLSERRPDWLADVDRGVVALAELRLGQCDANGGGGGLERGCRAQRDEQQCRDQ
jgi:hypothetical protein